MLWENYLFCSETIAVLQRIQSHLCLLLLILVLLFIPESYVRYPKLARPLYKQADIGQMVTTKPEEVAKKDTLTTKAVELDLIQEAVVGQEVADTINGTNNELKMNKAYFYDAEKEIQNRGLTLNNWCQKKSHPLKEFKPNYRTNLVSRWGTSLGNVTFWVCFTPKCASTSLTSSILHGTGYLSISQNLNGKDLGKKLKQGKHRCKASEANCLHEFSLLPEEFRSMDQEKISKPFKRLMFVREPLDRLVSAWRDKIHSGHRGKQYYYKTYTKIILRTLHFNTKFPDSVEDAWNQGLIVSFTEFVNWIVVGNNFMADEHWTPATRLCDVCAGRFEFIGHKEHYDEDIQECLKMLNVSTDVLPEAHHALNGHAAGVNENAVLEEIYTMYENVSESTFDRLINIYRSDYEAFGYEIPKFT